MGSEVSIVTPVGGAYVDGDIPRSEYIDPLGLGNGYAYYTSNAQGKCAVCGCHTRKWYVTKTTKGMFLCKECNFDVRTSISGNRPKTYGTM